MWTLFAPDDRLRDTARALLRNDCA